MLHIAAASQIRLDTAGRRCYRRKLAAGKTGLESIRCLKRRISHAVYRQLLADVQRNQYLEPAEADGTGPGGHWEASQESRAVDLFPHIDTLDQPLPGPAVTTLQPAYHARKSAERQSLKTTG